MDGEVVSRKQIHDAKERLNAQRTFIDIGSRKKPRCVPPPPKKNDDAKGDTTAQKKKFKGWKATVGGGFDHQFFNNAKLDELEKKEIEWT